MQSAEYAEFDALLRQLGEVFSKKITDDFARSYWSALKDQSLSSVRKNAETHMRFGKYFPKPFELRPKDEKGPKSAEATKAERDFQCAVEQNIRNWDERLRENPLETKRMLLAAYVARVEVQEDPRSVIYAEKMAWAQQVAARLEREGA